MNVVLQCRCDGGEDSTLTQIYLIDFSPTPAHSPDAYGSSKFFGWIIPTLRTSEFTVLQTVGLDAAVVSLAQD